MSEFAIRPSAKLLKAMYVFCALAAAAILIGGRGEHRAVLYLLILPAVAALWTAIRHLGRIFTRLTVEGERLRFESGVLGRTTRTMELRKVQDVRVDQSLGQRLINVGNLSIETAGESSRITIENIDSPREAADRILAAARGETKGPGA